MKFSWDKAAVDATWAVKIPLETAETPIGGHAIAPDAILVTHNLWEFSRVRMLQVEDWARKSA